MKKYPDLGPKFKPLVIESTGGWHGYSMDKLKIMAGHIASRTNKPTSFALSNLLCICSFALQRHQGTMLVPNKHGALVTNKLFVDALG
jgi:hypothetical protein